MKYRRFCAYPVESRRKSETGLPSMEESAVERNQSPTLKSGPLPVTGRLMFVSVSFFADHMIL